MSLTSVSGIAIRGVSAVVPKSVLANDQIGEQINQKYVRNLSDMVGVVERHIVQEDEFSSDLGAEAVRVLLTRLQWDPSSIDLLVVATQTPDRLFPGVSFEIHRDLKLPSSCTVFDINLGCSAFTHGIWIISTLLRGLGKRAILVNVDTMSRTIAPSDLGNQVLFGDAGTATAFEVDDAASPIYAITMSDGKGTESVCLPNSGMSANLKTPSHFVINGPAVLGLALRTVPKLIGTLLIHAKIEKQSIGMVVPHQANVFILDKLIDRLSVQPNKVVIGMKNFGNTSSASIPLAMCASLIQVNSLERELSLLIGFGTGFSLSAVIADLRSTIFCGVVTLSGR